MRTGLLLLILAIGGIARGQDTVEGLYQLTGNPNMFIRFTARNGELVARFLWDETAEVHFLPDSELVFIRKEEGEGGSVRIHFRKDEHGHVVHVTMGNGTEWDRAKQVAVSALNLKHLAGTYQGKEDPDNRLVITPHDSVLVIRQAWDGQRIVLSPLSSTFFFCPHPYFSLQVISPKTVKVMNRYTFQLTEN